MLEELQRLQTLTQKLISQLQLVQQQNRDLHTQLQAKPQTVEVEDPAVREALELTSVRNQELEQEIGELKQRYSSLQIDATALAERYGRLEQNAGELKNRFEALLAARDGLKNERDRLADEQTKTLHDQQAIIHERDELIIKNEHAKRKVEAIIQRLASLGQQKSNSDANQEISSLANAALENDGDAS